MRFRMLSALLLVLGLASPVAAQINVPNTFTPQTRILSSEVNANFAALGADALNRTGGTMIGTLTTQLLIPDGNNTRALGASGTRWSTVFGVAGNYSGVVTITDTTAGSLDIGGGLNAGTGNVAIIGADGRIPAISSTQFASLSGANLTGILETGIADGTLLARLAANETVTGNWTLSSASTVIGAAQFTGIGAGAPGKIGLSGNQLAFLGGTSGHAFFNSAGGLLTNVDATGVWTFSPANARGIVLNNTGANAGIQITSIGGSGTGYGIVSDTTGVLSIQHDADANPSITLNGATNAVAVTATGGITFNNPLTPTSINSGSAQPGFLAYNSAADAVGTGPVTVDFDTEAYDDAGNFVADTFTASVTGKYLFCGSVRFSSSNVAVLAQLNLITSARSYLLDEWSTGTSFEERTGGNCVHANMTTGQTAFVSINFNDASNSIDGDGSSALTYFSGRLVP